MCVCLLCLSVCVQYIVTELKQTSKCQCHSIHANIHDVRKAKWNVRTSFNSTLRSGGSSLGWAPVQDFFSWALPHPKTQT